MTTTIKRVVLYLTAGMLLCGIALWRFLPSSTIDVTLMGPIEMADGIGRQLVELASILQDDFSLQILPNHIAKEGVPPQIFKHVDLKTQTAKGKIVITENSLWDPGESPSKPFRTITNDHQIRIAYSMLEYTRIPTEWALKLNLYYDMVVVPDAFLVDVYQKSGVTIPIFTLPLGRDLQAFLQKPLKQQRGPVMTFANLSTALDRKNQLTLIRAFAKALGHTPDARLIINYRSGDDKIKETLTKEIEKLHAPNIYITPFRLKDDAYKKLWDSIDCYVSLSKGEGFSIQPREAMALGIPVIVTDNTAQSTICQSGLVLSVPSLQTEQAFYCKQRIPNGFQFACTVDEAAKALLDMYHNYDSYLQKGTLARQWAAAYDYKNPSLQACYKNLVSPKKIILGDRNLLETNFIMTTSRELYNKYAALFPTCEASLAHP